MMKEKVYFCQECGKVISELEKEYTLQKAGKALCWDCLKRHIVLEELKKKENKQETIEETIRGLQQENIKVTAFEQMYSGGEEAEG